MAGLLHSRQALCQLSHILSSMTPRSTYRHVSELKGSMGAQCTQLVLLCSLLHGDFLGRGSGLLH